ncbi:MAG: TRAP transporter large permease [Spirochaetia bacterium]|nr:TRAP transporter large permease [Spirochaetia bacterium]
MGNSLFILVFLLLMLIKVPVAFSLGLSCLFYFVTSGVPLETIPQIMLGTFESFTLLAIPLFMLAGQIMNMGGVTNRLFDFCKQLVGHIPGGLGHVNIVSSLIFAGMSGSATADSAGLGTIEINYMKQEGYDPAFAAAVTAASSTVGTIMPPSLGFVIYGAMTGTSIGGLFIAGIVPALLMTAAQMIIVYLEAKRRSFKVYPRATWKMVLGSFIRSFLPMLTPIIILAGILTGFATPTEAAVISVLYAIFLGSFVYRELSFDALIQTLVEVGKGTSRIMLIVSFATVFGWILTYEGIPAMLTELLTGISSNPYVILLILNVFILFLGCFMEGISIMLIIIPVLMPLLLTLGVDLMHFGVVLELNLNIGLITPPLGVCAYVAADIAQVSFEEVMKAIWPFLLVLIVVLLIITFIPETTLALPHLFGFR